MKLHQNNFYAKIIALCCILTLTACASSSQQKNASKEDVVRRVQAEEKYKTLDEFCKNGDAKACHSVAYLFFDGELPEKNNEFIFYLTKACNGGMVSACNSLGVRYHSNSDYEKAYSFYTKACQGKNYGGCFGLGQMYEHGNGVRKDLSKAKKYYRQSCDLGGESGCSWYESMNRKSTAYSKAQTQPETKTNAQICLNGKGQKAIIKQACNDAFTDQNASEENKLKYLKQGCSFGDYSACVHLAYRYENGDTVRRNHQTAISYLTRADKIACGNHKICQNAAAQQNKTFKLPKETNTMIAQNPEGYPLVIFSDPKIQKVYKGISPEQFLRNIGLYESYMQMKNK